MIIKTDKYARFNADGVPTAFYSRDIHGVDIPTDTVKISFDEWLEFINNAGQRKWVNGKVEVYTPPPPPITVPEAVAASSAELALFDAGLLDAVQTIVAEHPYPPVRIYFTKANTWRRDNAYVQALGPELGLTSEDIDNLFLAALAYE